MSNRTFKSFFMPKFCRFFLNDAVKPTKLPDSSPHDPSSPKLGCTGNFKKRSKTTAKNINNNNNNNNNNSNRFLAYNFSVSSSTRSSGHSNRYNKLDNLFFNKRLISPAIDTASINHNHSNRFHSCRFPASTYVGHSDRYTNLGKKLTSPEIDINNTWNGKFVSKRSKSCNGRGRIATSNKKYHMTSSEDYDIVKVTVAEKFDPPLPVVKCNQEVNVNLSERRGIQIKTLQIQPIQKTLNQNTINNNGQILLPISQQQEKSYLL